MGLKSVIPKTFKKAPDALLFLKCGMMGLKKSIGYLPRDITRCLVKIV